MITADAVGDYLMMEWNEHALSQLVCAGDAHLGLQSVQALAT